MSVDGKIALPDYSHIRIGSHEDLKLMSTLRSQAEAVLVGGRTFRATPLPMIESNKHLSEPHIRSKPILNVILTRSGILSADNSIAKHRNVKVLIIGPRSLDVKAHQDRFNAEVITLDDPTITSVLDILCERGIGSTLLECGGDLLFQAIKEQRLDSLYVTICPLIMGGRNFPTLVDNLGFSERDGPRLTLSDFRVIGNEIFLKYDFPKTKYPIE